MKIRILKNFCKAYHSYGFTKQGLAIDMKELMGKKFWRKDYREIRKYFNRDKRLYIKTYGKNAVKFRK